MPDINFRFPKAAGQLLMRWTALLRLAAMVAGQSWRRAEMDNVTTIGLDIAKSVFQVHGVDAVGALRAICPHGRTNQQKAQITLANGEPSIHGQKAGARLGCCEWRLWAS
jgi:hypothetical protein